MFFSLVVGYMHPPISIINNSQLHVLCRVRWLAVQPEPFVELLCPFFVESVSMTTFGDARYYILQGGDISRNYVVSIFTNFRIIDQSSPPGSPNNNINHSS
jgi:hypothetical protein